MPSRVASSLVLLVGAASLLAGCKGGSQAVPEPTAVSVVTLHQQNVPIIATLPGRALASEEAEIRPRVDGIVKRLVFKQGSMIKAGDLLYQLDPAPYQAAYDSAKAALEKAKAGVPSAKAKLRRYEELAKSKGVSEQDVEDARAALAEAVADVSAAEADLAVAKINLDYTNVTAPIAGVIGKSSVTEGALVTADQTDALATVLHLDPIYVDLSVSSVKLLNYRRLLREGKASGDPLETSARLILEDGSTYEQPGKIAFADADISASTASFIIRAQFPNPDGLVLPGSFVRADVTMGANQRAYLVPQRAVSRDPKGDATALFVTAEGKVEVRKLQTLRAIGSSWVVDKGLSDGDRVIVEGLQKVHAGEAVTAEEVQLDSEGLVSPPQGKAQSQPEAALRLRGSYGGG